MKKIRDWKPWVKMVVGAGVFAVGETSLVLGTRDYAVTGGASPSLFIQLGSFAFLAGLILLVWGFSEAVRKHKKTSGILIFSGGILLGVLLIPALPSLWEWSIGGVVGFIPTPFLLPVLFVIPGLLIYKGLQNLRS